MRSGIILGLVFALAAVPAVQAQQASEPIMQEQSELQPIAAPSASVEASPTAAHVEAVPVRYEDAEATAAQRTTARNALTIIGAVVVVLALVSFLR